MVADPSPIVVDQCVKLDNVRTHAALEPGVENPPHPISEKIAGTC